MRGRPPWLFYAACILSGGIFLFFWQIFMMMDVNAIEGRLVFQVKRAAWFVAISVVLFCLSLLGSTLTFGMISVIRTVWLVLVFTLGLLLDAFMFVVLVRVSLHVTAALGYRSPRAQAALMVILMFVGAISFIILQKRINALIERRGIIASG